MRLSALIRVRSRLRVMNTGQAAAGRQTGRASVAVLAAETAAHFLGVDGQGCGGGRTTRDAAIASSPSAS